MSSSVLGCGVSKCAFNQSSECHASSVSIGSDHAICDTFALEGLTERAAQPEISDCKISECGFNENLSCQADGIEVTDHEQHADCATFTSNL